MRRSIRAVVAVILAMVVSVSAVGQSLADDPRYRELIEEADRLAAAAREAIDEGRYDDAVALSRRARELTDEADAYADIRVLRFRAVAFRNRANDRLAVARRLNAEERFPNAWAAASEAFETGTTAYDAERWEESIDSFRTAVAALAPVEPIPFSPSPRTPAPAPAAERSVETPIRPGPILGGHPPVALDPGPVSAELPRFYLVRLIPSRRDSFWRIAAYDFVYGDPWKWRILYNANREKLQDPGNPHLIQPGMLFQIPELPGETREGVWTPE